MTIEERLEALEKEVQQLKDVQAIKELKSRYFCAMDTKDWEAMEATMAPDIETSYSDGKLVFHGPKEITNYLAETMPKTLCIRDIIRRSGLRAIQLPMENGICRMICFLIRAILMKVWRSEGLLFTRINM